MLFQNTSAKSGGGWGTNGLMSGWSPPPFGAQGSGRHAGDRCGGPTTRQGLPSRASPLSFRGLHGDHVGKCYNGPGSAPKLLTSVPCPTPATTPIPWWNAIVPTKCRISFRPISSSAPGAGKESRTPTIWKPVHPPFGSQCTHHLFEGSQDTRHLFGGQGKPGGKPCQPTLAGCGVKNGGCPGYR